ncbi:MAG: tRNA dihydrouridine synthase DusB [Candidatus Binatia bacterium]
MTASAFHVGTVRVAPNIVLAPMSGITDSAFRSIIKDANPGAVGLVVSELISVEGLSRRERKSLRILRSVRGEQPLAIQLFGWQPERMAEAARVAADHGAAIIDINCGCPTPKVVKRGGGAELMRQTDRLRLAVRAVRGAVSLPVSVKIRAGWDDHSRNAVEVARLLEAEGAAMVAIHGRTRRQLYSGQCDWELIRAVKESVRIPVVGSGDIDSAESALRRLAETGVDGVMIGRATLSNPWIFRQIAARRAGRSVCAPTDRDVQALLVSLVERLAAQVHPLVALGRARGLVCRMTKGVCGGPALRDAAMRAPSIDALLELLRRTSFEQHTAEKRVANTLRRDAIRSPL